MSRQEAEWVGTLRESFFSMDSHLDSSLMSNDPHAERFIDQTIFIKLSGIAAAISSSKALSRSLRQYRR
jgi:hypothetical protein